MPESVAFRMPPGSATFWDNVPVGIQIPSIVQVWRACTSCLVHAVDRFQCPKIFAVSNVAVVVQAGIPEAENTVFVLQLYDLSCDVGAQGTTEVHAADFSTEKWVVAYGFGS